MGEFDCCFRNYYLDLNLVKTNNVPKRNEVGSEKLKSHCYFKRLHVDVSSLIWCYSLSSSVPQEKQGLGKPTLGFRINSTSMLGGIPLIYQFCYGSVFKKNLNQKQNLNDPMDSGLLYLDCRQLYNDLSKEDQFLVFIRDSLNTTNLIIAVIDQIQQKLDQNELFSYKILGCSFYL